MNETAVRPAIVVVGYNRIDSIRRVLDSVIGGIYNDDNIPLIVSLDHSELEEEIVEVVEGYRAKWRYGFLEIKTTPKRLGLRNHIIRCGDVACEYGAVIILEDDIVVSPYFYQYAVEAIRFYGQDEKIAGFALYSHKWNGYTREFFEPLNNGKDAYWGQFSVTWGQCWTKEQWLGFREWYEKHQHLNGNKNIPEEITNWPETSWGKYFVHYIVEKDKYYIMPYTALATNCSDAGQHIKTSSNEHQVPLLYGKKDYVFPREEEAVKYNIFFENMSLRKFIENSFKIKDVCISRYGRCNYEEFRYLLSTVQLDYKIIKSYSMNMSPYELNVFYNVEGNDLYLYDLKEFEKHKKSRRHNYILINNDIKYLSFKRSVLYSIYRLKDSFCEEAKRWLKK